MESKSRIRYIIIALGVLFVAGGVYLYTLIGTAGDRWPAYNEPGTLTNDVTRLQASVAQLEKEVAKIPEARKQLEALQVEYELAIRVLPKENSPDQLVGAIRTKAEQAGVKPVSLRPSTSGRTGKGGGPFEEWSFALDIYGTYDQIATFINKMEEFESTDSSQIGSEKRFFRLQDIDITASENGLGNLHPLSVVDSTGKPVRAHSCKLTMQTYRYTGED